ncbi:glycoside hydrolase family 5 protein [Truncatella angustata]|uniref:Glycoside hydrolase family 5 protein n=1 Tax=Truncatella angustata TaxID=152316 RepID=A0A9P8UTW9_9PEZI|nr:glycoside hydrolase family 5 protein [Truncatella angustata]KAH6658148.1 glycoside hydrolase family 5 protein [Truncatella angustata]
MPVRAQTAITVSMTVSYQEIHGFGFSQAFGRASEFQDLSDTTIQKAALDYLFNTSTGAGFSIIRNRIGSGGSGDSIEPNSPGSPNSTPTYVWDGDDRGQVWFSQQAKSYGVDYIYADAWSAPGFMKTSGNESTPGYLCGSSGHACSTGDWRQAYANFLVKYVEYYNAEGLPITQLGFLNEPDYEVSYSQMQINDDASDAIDFIRVLNKTLVNAGHTDVGIACCDTFGWKNMATYLNYLVSGGATSHLRVITAHSYSSDATTSLNATSLPRWNTEGAPSGAFSTTWYSSGAATEGFTWANKLAVAIVNAQLSAYLFWEGFENGQTQSASHLVDVVNGVATPSAIMWAFAMWSRYIRPGAIRVATSGTISNVIIGAFKNTDSSVVVVFTNGGTSAASAELSFSGFTPKAASAWATNQSSTFASSSATLANSKVTVSVPAHGVVTVKMI